MIYNPELTTATALLRFNQDFDGGNNGDVSIDGTATVLVDGTFTVDVVTINDGNVSLVNPTSQLRAKSVALQNGSLRVEGEATPTNPLPTLQNDIVSSGGFFAVSEGNVAIPQGLRLERGNTRIDYRDLRVDAVDFDGLLLSGNDGTLSISANSTAPLTFNGAPGADANGVLPNTIINNSGFAIINTATGEIVPLTGPVLLPDANPGDPLARAIGNQTLTSDKDVSALQIDNGNLNLGGFTLNVDGVLVDGVSSAIANGSLMPHDKPGNDPNTIFIHAPEGGDRLDLDADIADNNDPTVLTFNAPQAGRMTVNSALSKTGDTNILGGTVILNGPNANLGGTRVVTFAGVSVVLIDNNLTQDITALTGPFPAKIEADGNSTISGDITVEVNSRNDRAVKVTAPQADDTLTISGTLTRGGTGNPIEGQGQAIFQVGEDFGRGTFHLEIDTSSSGVTTRLSGTDQRDIFITETVGDLDIRGQVDVRGSFDVQRDMFISESDTSTELLLSVGESLGTVSVGEDASFAGTSFTYEAEVDDTGGSDVLVVGETLSLGAASNVLDISFFSGATLSATDYTLATYGLLVGTFDTVMFDGSPIADPTMPGAIGGTHRLQYRTDSLVLTTNAPLPIDPDDDGDIDGNDFLLIQRSDPALIAAWQSQFGSGLGAAAAIPSADSGTAAVPEPGVWLLIFSSLSVLACLRQPARLD